MSRLAAADEGRSLCHGDFHWGNLVVQAGTLHLLDWGKACRGAPAADMARTVVMLRDGKLGGTADTRVAEPVRAVLTQAHVRAYKRVKSNGGSTQISPARSPGGCRSRRRLCWRS